jgi:hypothetical protein
VKVLLRVLLVRIGSLTSLDIEKVLFPRVFKKGETI